MRELLRDLRNNGAQAALALGEWEIAISQASEALKCADALDGDCNLPGGAGGANCRAREKALFRRASAHAGRGEAAGAGPARADLEALLRLQPDNKAARALLRGAFFAAPAGAE